MYLTNYDSFSQSKKKGVQFRWYSQVYMKLMSLSRSFDGKLPIKHAYVIEMSVLFKVKSEFGKSMLNMLHVKSLESSGMFTSHFQTVYCGLVYIT